VRTTFLAAWWAKGGRKYWNIAAAMKNAYNFYYGIMRINPREFLEVFRYIEGGALLNPVYDITQHAFEKHSCWNDTHWRPHAIC
jgi:hypothetical protein